MINQASRQNQLPVASCQLSVNSKLKTQHSKLCFLLLLAIGYWLFAVPAYSTEWSSIDISQDWKFQADPEKKGVKQKYCDPDFDDSAWKDINAGASWESQGFQNYDGMGWYRKRVKIPSAWQGKPIVVGFGGVDDEYTLYINGKSVNKFGSKQWNLTLFDKLSSFAITPHIQYGKDALICLRVTDWGKDGGIVKLPALIVNDEKFLANPLEVLQKYAGKNPGLVWPPWLFGRGKTWTVVGTEGGVAETLVGPDGAFSPANRSYQITVWVYVNGDNKLYAPENLAPTWSLEEGHLPISKNAWEAGPVSVQTTVFSESPGTEQETVVHHQTLLTNNSQKPQEGFVYYAVRPFTPAGHISKIGKIEFDQKENAVLIHSGAALLFEQLPEKAGFCVLNEEDVSSFAMKKSMPGKKSIEDLGGLCTGAVRFAFKLKPGEQISYWTKAPVYPQALHHPFTEKLKNEKAVDAFERVKSAWKTRFGNIMQITLPEKRYTDAYYASAAYTLINLDENMMHPGPLAYDYFWYRDSAYIMLSLLRIGTPDVVKRCLQFFVDAQLPTGQYPSIVDANNRSIGPDEWDSQGQGIFSFIKYYKFTGDLDWMKKVYPGMVKAAKFLKDVRNTRLTKEFQNTPMHGILSPSVSAEDIGPGNYHHYWDDFWGVAGFWLAAEAASILGEKQDAKWMKEEGDALHGSTMESISRVLTEKNIHYIPNGPEDVTTSSMARGTSPGLWPNFILNRNDSLVRDSFNTYYKLWFLPSGGGYLHNNNIWPYGALEIAHAFLFLEDDEKMFNILDWDLDHQTASGVYAWSEVANPNTFLFQAGDMPHTWMCAEYINLLRDMLLYEDGDQLVLSDGVPFKWLDSGEDISVKNARTEFGTVSYALKTNSQEKTIRLDFQISNTGAKRIVLKIPKELTIKKAEINGKSLKTFSPHSAEFPPVNASVVLWVN